MKYLAHLEKNGSSKIVSIYEVIKALNSANAENWEKREYYSLWYLTPMVAKPGRGKVSPHFAFKKGLGGNENSGGGESLEHDLAKKILYDQKYLSLKFKRVSEILKFSEIKIEERFPGIKRSADLFAKVSHENKLSIPKDSYIAIEIHRSNRISGSKKIAYQKHNIRSIEIDIDKDIRFNGNIEILQNRLEGYFKYPREARTLHNPDYKKRYEKVQHNDGTPRYLNVNIQSINSTVITKREMAVQSKQDENLHKSTLAHDSIPCVKKPHFFTRLFRYLFGKQLI